MRSLLFAALALAAAPACSKQKADAEEADVKIPEMTVDQVDHDLTAGAIVALDANSDETRKRQGIVPGAVLLTGEKYAAGELPADKAKKLVFYCGGPG
jgi:hypothetical protein